MLVDRDSRSGILGARRGLSAFLLTTLFIPAFYSNVYGQVSAARETDQTQLRGGIEIDPEGIKAAVIRISDTAQGPGAEVVFTEAFNVTLGRDQDGKLTQEVVKTAGRAIKDYYTLIHQQYQVPIQQIHIVGSSDLYAA